MSAETLRALSRTYAVGDIDREAYRLQRRELLAGIAAGTVEVVRFELPEPESPTVFPYDDDDGDTTQEIIPQFDVPSTSKSNTTVIALCAAAVIVLALLAWTAQQWLAPEPTTTVATPAQPVPPSQADRDEALLSGFVEGGSWTDQSLAGLTHAWDQLDPSRQSMLRDSEGMRVLRDGIVEQIAAEDALLALGDATSALEKQGRLFALADHLGIHHPRIDRARAAWSAHQAEAADTDRPVVVPSPTDSSQDTIDKSGQLQVPSAPIELNRVEPTTITIPDPAGPPATAASPAVVAADPAPPATRETTPSAAPLRSNCAAAVAKKRRPYCIDVLESGTKGPVLVVLAPGKFEMGGSREHEQPRRTININYPLAIGLFEISVAELQRFCSATSTTCPTQPWPELDMPAVNVNWSFARAYTEWLSTITGVLYRLPSEAEWEYAARGGTSTLFPFGDELLPTHARYSFKRAAEKPLAANDRSVNRNAFRLFHMVGNVREWVLDGWRDNYAGSATNGSAVNVAGSDLRVVRGGSYADSSEALRSAARTALAAAAGDAYTGFRVVRIINN